MITLKEARTKQFITQRELAAKAGVHLMTIIRLENGKHKPKFKTAKAIARVLKMKPQDIDFNIKA
jgi:DNA-binding XRE family transcriptional regulator